MGYASYLQDILDRLHVDLVEPVHRALGNLDLAKKEELIQRMNVFLRECEKMRLEVRKNLDLIGDLDVDIICELEQQRRRNDKLERENNTLRKSNDYLKKELEREHGQRKKTESKVQQVEDFMKEVMLSKSKEYYHYGKHSSGLRKSMR